MNTQEERTIFALDIGTRSVIGIVGYQNGDLFQVECVEQEEYQKRAVVDGQIEDIGETAKVAGAVKKRLEERLGRPLKQVYIAAAGRVLRTVEVVCQRTVEDGQAIGTDFIARLEQDAVQQAYESLYQNETEETSYFCVGHAVKTYELDGYHLSNLLDHRGRNAGAELIATFLPREVVESLYTTMGRIGLTVAGLTLEPIAAMNAVIPDDLRKLNLALVDIGAGTSDIALCAGGGVSAYTMATTAGDEITETIMESCLVDFQTAENLKKQLAADPEAGLFYTDILGFPHEEEGETFAERIRPAVQSLADEICRNIVQANGKAPAAVFLVGGGSRTPLLCPLVAKGLGSDPNRVAVGGNNYMQRMLASAENIFGPEYATPAGIALTAARQREGDAFTATVNGARLRLVDGWDNSVLGILQLAGFRYSQIMGRGGRSLTFTVNGERRTIRGGLPGTGSVTRNGEPAALNEQVTPGDTLVFVPALPGADAALCLAGLSEAEWGGEPTVNGEAAELGYEIQQGDEILFPLPEEYLLELEPLDSEPTPEAPDDGELDDGELEQSWEGEPEPEAAVSAPHVTQPERPPEPGGSRPEVRPVPVPEGPFVIQAPPEPTQAPEPAGPPGIHVMLNGMPLFLEQRENGLTYQFFDLLAYTDIDPKHPKGNIVQRLNDRPASYLDPIREGDRIEIYWDTSRP